MSFEFRTASRDEYLDSLPMREFYVDRGLASMSDVRDFEGLLSRDPSEHRAQGFLSQHPWMLAPWAGLGPSRWVLSHKKLGVEYVPDFLAADSRSDGIRWAAIELESPRAKMLTKAGDFTAVANHAIRQIQDWRTWLEQNLDYARRSKEANGLGLAEINSRIRGIVFIGRRGKSDEKANARRKQIDADMGISLHSFDTLIDWARNEAEHWTRPARQGRLIVHRTQDSRH